MAKKPALTSITSTIVRAFNAYGTPAEWDELVALALDELASGKIAPVRDGYTDSSTHLAVCLIRVAETVALELNLLGLDVTCALKDGRFFVCHGSRVGSAALPDPDELRSTTAVSHWVAGWASDLHTYGSAVPANG